MLHPPVEPLDEVRLQLSRLEEELQGRNPILYRDLALYLQVLRDGLLNSVQQACFHLATRYGAANYCALDDGRRQALHGRLASLVQRASSLLTVEQLVQLAGRLGREHQQRRRRRQRAWLQQLREESAGAAPGPPPDAVSALDPAEGVPQGSIHLEAAPPIDLGRWQLQTSAAGHADTLLGAEAEVDADAEADVEAEAEADGMIPTPAEDGMLPAVLWDGGSSDALPAPWDTPALPSDPQVLVVWLEGFELALVRRLRNLSHAINVELLRVGLNRSLLPLNLLQAALQGQLEPQPAPANLLRLQLPLAPQLDGPLDSVAVLLRLADLELEQPRLRSCRSRWQRQRQEIRTMAEHHRRLQRRLQRLEAERLWHQDIARTPPSSQPS